MNDFSVRSRLSSGPIIFGSLLLSASLYTFFSFLDKDAVYAVLQLGFILSIIVVNVVNGRGKRVEIEKRQLSYYQRNFVFPLKKESVDLKFVDRAIFFTNKYWWLGYVSRLIPTSIFFPYIILLKKGLGLKSGLLISLHSPGLRRLKNYLESEFPAIAWTEINSLSMGQKALREIM